MTTDPDTSNRSDDRRDRPVGCQPSLEELYQYMDGVLDEQRQQLVRSHIDACGGCGEIYHVQLGFRHLLEVRCQAELPPDLPGRVFRAITDLR